MVRESLLRCTSIKNKHHLFIHEMKLEDGLLASGISNNVCLKSVQVDINEFIADNDIELMKVPYDLHSWIE